MKKISNFFIEKDNFCYSLGEYFINRGLAHQNWDWSKIRSSPEAAGAKRKVLGEEQARLHL